MNSIVRAVSIRGFFVILCACGGQAALLPDRAPQTPVGDAILNLSLPNDSYSSEIFGMNGSGEIAIQSTDEHGMPAYVGKPPYDRNDFHRIAYPGATTTTATAVNDEGDVAGFYSDPRGNIVAFTEKKQGWATYDGPWKTAEYLGMNDRGATVGFYSDPRGVRHAFERAATGTLAELRPPKATSAIAAAINDNGVVIGYMTLPSGSVKGFWWNGETFVTLSYPGASATRALGINNSGKVVGTYRDASGNMHGFILSDAAGGARWKTFDEPGARGMTVLTAINGAGNIAGYYRNGNGDLRPLLRRGVKPASSLPLVIPVWGLGGDPGDTDPGATPDQHLFAAVLDNSANSSSSLAKNCPGVSASSTCQPYKYIDVLYDACNTTVTLAAYQWANANDESAFVHNYPNGKTSSNRMTYGATPDPDCSPDGHNAYARMNAGDSGYNKYLYDIIWSGTNYQTDFPAPYGVMEDQAAVFAGIVVGGYGSVSTEYGSGIDPSGFANQVGNSDYHDATDWETALGIFVNGACGSTCLNMALNGVATGYGNVAACSIISGGHCHAQYQSGLIDNQAAIDNICSTVTGSNLAYFQAERPIFAGRFGYEFMNSQTMVVDINTEANLYSHTSGACAATKIVDLETSYGEGGLGDITGGHRVRLAALAYRWMIGNPSTGIPDRVLSYQLTEGGTTTEVPYFFEDTLVPYGAETSVAKYVWNGSTQTIGGGCPAADGDRGGAVSLLAQCVGSSGIYCQQYEHLYIDGSDYGKAAACLNTSSSTEDVVSSWFKHDPISSYSYELALQGGEMTSVPYSGVSGGKIALPTCTNTKYCTGQSTLSTQVSTFKGNGTDELCGPCGLILLQKN